MKPKREHVIYHYQYSIATNNEVKSSRDKRPRTAAVSGQRDDTGRYVWLTGHWTVCDKDCGEGLYGFILLLTCIAKNYLQIFIDY